MFSTLWPWAGFLTSAYDVRIQSINQSNFNQVAVSHILRDTAAAVLSLTFHLFLKALFRFVFVIPLTAFYGRVYSLNIYYLLCDTIFRRQTKRSAKKAL